MSTSTLTRVQTRLPSAVAVAVGLAAGFGVAQGTGVRALGGIVFAAGGLVAGWSWLAVGLVTVAAAALAYRVADRPDLRQRPRSEGSPRAFQG
jgi:hypothetical protein